MTKIKNNGHKIVHIGKRSVMPNEEITVADKVADTPAIKALAKRKVIDVTVVADEVVTEAATAEETTVETATDASESSDNATESAAEETTVKKTTAKKTTKKTASATE